MLHKAKNICSTNLIFQNEILNLRKIFSKNGDPISFFNHILEKFLNQYKASFTQATAVARLNFLKMRVRKSSFSHTATYWTIYCENFFFSRLLHERSSTGRLFRRFNHIKSSLLLYSLYAPKRVTSLWSPFPRHYSRAIKAPLEETLQPWRAVGSTVSDLISRRFEPQTSRSRDERVTLDQLFCLTLQIFNHQPVIGFD